jgi:hypothetical protein
MDVEGGMGMSKREIEAALQEKGIRVKNLFYSRTVTPNGTAPFGWVVEMTEECDEALTALGFAVEPEPHECESWQAMVEWIDTLPTIQGETWDEVMTWLDGELQKCDSGQLC